MRKKITRGLGIVLSLLMVLSVISFPTLKPKAAAGTIDDFVERCYTVTLDRGSDSEGFADWKGQLLNGRAVGVHVAYGFLFSPEYTRKNKSSEEYVTDLYMLFMGREPDEAGFNDWVGQLKAGKTKIEVFAGFANSQEFYNICESYGITAGRFVIGYDRFQVNDVNLFVERLYKVCFGRRGDIGGQNNWVEKLIRKQITGSECARSFIQGKEYENLGLSDADYVENLYIALMGRASDAQGKANWVNGLANGMTRDEVFAGFVNSVEFDNICKQYNINRGAYTATNKGTYNPNKQNNNNNSNNQNNNNNNSNNQYNEKTNYKVGDVILFGKYEQDGNISNGMEDIEWEILSVEEGRILVISKYGLEMKPYNIKKEDVTWETCTLRKWLNNDFYNAAFSDVEKKEIPSVMLANKPNPYYGTTGGNNTTDKVFCLSLEEIEKYFGEYNWSDSEKIDGYNQKLICAPTLYARESGVEYEVLVKGENGYGYGYLEQFGYTSDAMWRVVCSWWLRSPGYKSNCACLVFDEGQEGARINREVDQDYLAVRPALYIEYKSNNKPVNPAHTHNYNQKNTASKYLMFAANCYDPAIYYYSCECGEKDISRTFQSGSALGHDWDKGTVDKEATLTERGSIIHHCKRSGCSGETFESIPSILENAKVGDIIKFGKYEQDNNTSNGKEDIEWQILSKEKGKVLVISKYALDSRQYNRASGSFTWKDCYLKLWLNQGFYNAAFSDSDKSIIQSVTIKNNELYFGNEGGNDTTHKVFCLSIEEIKKYYGDYYPNSYDSTNKFGYNQKLMCSPTQYAIKKEEGAEASVLTPAEYNNLINKYHYTNDDNGRTVCKWWLRSPDGNDFARYVDRDGKLGSGVQADITVKGVGVRPALYLKY